MTVVVCMVCRCFSFCKGSFSGSKCSFFRGVKDSNETLTAKIASENQWDWKMIHFLWGSIWAYFSRANLLLISGRYVIPSGDLGIPAETDIPTYILGPPPHHQVTVATKINTLFIRNPELNLHIWLLIGVGGRSNICFLHFLFKKFHAFLANLEGLGEKLLAEFPRCPRWNVYVAPPRVMRRRWRRPCHVMMRVLTTWMTRWQFFLGKRIFKWPFFWGGKIYIQDCYYIGTIDKL